jgi:hypothetical protein
MGRLRPAAIVSCDIVGHSHSPEHQVQLVRVRAINELVRRTLEEGGAGEAVWASGGDGGHVLFFGEGWRSAAVLLITDLRRLAREHLFQLRITGHRGSVEVFEGADGRPQVVGDGINTAGWILGRGSSTGVIVSTEFRDEFLEGGEEGGGVRVDFHSSRPLRPARSRPQELVLFSTADFRSSWESPTESDLAGIRAAVESKRAWDVVYHAKRMLEISRESHEINRALARLGPEDFFFETVEEGRRIQKVNPFVGYLDTRSLREIIMLGELVERDYNEVLCRYGDKGSTMFLILRGRVGVYKPGGGPGARAGRPDFFHGVGEVVGELAFALNRNRTADLVTLSETALLTFNFEEISQRLARSKPGRNAIAKVGEFISGRVLEHACHHLPYMIGADRRGPLTRSEESWESLLRAMAMSARVVDWDYRGGSPMSAPEAAADAGRDRRGVYILAAGSLASAANREKVLRGEEFPLLHIELAESSTQPHRYVVENGPVKILKIDAQAVAEELPISVRREVERGATAASYYYDVFISHSFRDASVVRRWRDELERGGLRVYVDEQELGKRFDEHIENMISDSLLFAVFVSPNSMAKAGDRNWVTREVKFRENNFVNPLIVPVCLPGGDLDVFGTNYTAIELADVGDLSGAKRIINLVNGVRAGDKDPPVRRRHGIEAQI